MIRVGFSARLNNPLSWTIRQLTRSEVSHTWLLISPIFGAEMVLEATVEGFRFVSYTKFVTNNEVVDVLDVAQDLMPGIKEAVRWMGSSYDFGGLFGMLFVMVGRWFRRKWANPLHSPNELFCSEAVVRVLQWAGVSGSAELDPESMTPQDVLDYLRGLNGNNDNSRAEPTTAV